MSELVSTSTQLIPRKIVKQRLGGCSDMTIWRLQQSNGFPVPVMINHRAFYYAHEFDEWLKSRPRRELPNKVA